MWFKFLILVIFMVSVSGLAHGLEFDGVIEPYVVVKVGSGVPGIIETVQVDRGDFVKKGQVLATLRSGVEKATVEANRVRSEMEGAIEAKGVRLDFLMRSKNRNESLFKTDILPFSQMDEIETNRLLAEKELKEAMENKRLAELELKRAIEIVERMTIRSPINGVVMERHLSPGEYVEDQPIMKLAQIDKLNVEVIVPVNHFASIEVGMRAKVVPEISLGDSFVAEVKIVDRVIDAASGTFGIRLELPNPNYRLPAGLRGKVIFPDKKGKN